MRTAEDLRRRTIWLQIMPGTIAIVIVFLLVPYTLFSRQRGKSFPLRERIPAASPKSYQQVKDAVDWKNPYLIVQSDGIEVRKTGADKIGPTIQVDNVIDFLGRLPRTAWPYGLVVGVQENGILSGNDDALISHNTEALLALLSKLGVKTELWPTG
jgi:hypothetical protein